MDFNYGYPYNYNPTNTYMQQRPMQSGIVCRPVASIEEAKNMQVQFDGSLYAFINLAAGEIYTKQFNFNTGNTDFEVYSKAAPAQPVIYATQNDIEELRKELMSLKKSKKKAEVIEDDE